MPKPRLAAIDIGTNSFHLIIVEVDEQTGHFKILGREREIVRLGSSSTDMKHLSPDAINRGIETLKRFKGFADSAGATVRAIATSAVREAINKRSFINTAKKETGINIEIASGFEEARYIYLGVLQALPIFDKRVLLIDIGGGSTEFLIGFKREIDYDNSLKLGAIRLTKRFFDNEKLDNKSVKDCRKFIQGTMNPVTRQIKNLNFDLAVGSSGTILTIANIINVKKGASADSKINNFSFNREELNNVVEEIVDAKTIKQLSKIPGLDPERADIITAGAIILEQVFKELKIKEITVSEYALREGVIFDTIENKFVLKEKNHLQSIRYRSVIHIAENYKYEPEHSLHVTKLALQIFDQTRILHMLSYSDREYLEAAGILHEVGCFVSHSQHHRHSYYLIRNSDLLGFTENEKELIANIARYHRKSHPKPKHPDFEKLSSEDRMLIKKLASILRVADGLDRTHSSIVSEIRVGISSEEVTFSLEKKHEDATLELEIWAAESKKALFEETFGVKVKFEVIDSISN
jgi:exopolyphosphatase/guanosine-5'-triphosphate,3'-diphosphate pyrophosphatase